MATDEYVRELEERVRIAERVCGMVAMTATDRQTARGKALTQAWMIWEATYGGRAVPVSDEEVRRLAEIRDKRVAETLASLERNYPEILAKMREHADG